MPFYSAGSREERNEREEEEKSSFRKREEKKSGKAFLEEGMRCKGKPLESKTDRKAADFVVILCVEKIAQSPESSKAL